MQNKVYPPDHQWTILEIVNWTKDFFASRHIDSPRATAEIILAHVLDLERIDLYLRHDQPLTQDELLRFKTLIKKRIKREPVAYIVGKKEFWSMDLAVCRECLIPRPETECLVEKALMFIPESHDGGAHFQSMNILELGTGSGAIILALASERSGHRFFASDKGIGPLLLTRHNAARLESGNKIHFFCGDWMSALRIKPVFDMVVSNPPYIPSDTIPTLEPEIHRYEPFVALDGGKDGLFCLTKIIRSAHLYLVKGED